MKKFVVIVAAGAGKRFGEKFPKQFELLHGKPLLMHSIKAFYEADKNTHIIIVIPKDFVNRWKDLCAEHDFTIFHKIIEGGPERFHSVKNGLSLVQNQGLVAVHDGVRPLVNQSIIKNAFRMAEKYGAVVPVIEVSDSIRTVEGGTHKHSDRKKLRLVQTPQVFTCAILKKAYQLQYDDRFTDDATVVETSGERILLVEGSSENMKVTSPTDMIIAEALLKARKHSQ